MTGFRAAAAAGAAPRPRPRPGQAPTRPGGIPPAGGLDGDRPKEPRGQARPGLAPRPTPAPHPTRRSHPHGLLLDASHAPEADPADADGDAQAPFSAGGTDCDDEDATIYSGATEVRDDGPDNDGDAFVDCEDDDCADATGCYEDCANGTDDDGLVDCEDADCPYAEPCSIETDPRFVVDTSRFIRFVHYPVGWYSAYVAVELSLGTGSVQDQADGTKCAMSGGSFRWSGGAPITGSPALHLRSTGHGWNEHPTLSADCPMTLDLSTNAAPTWLYSPTAWPNTTTTVIAPSFGRLASPTWQVSLSATLTAHSTQTLWWGTSTQPAAWTWVDRYRVQAPFSWTQPGRRHDPTR